MPCARYSFKIARRLSFDEPVHDTHLYLLLAPSAHLLAAAPITGPSASSAHTGRQQPSDDDEASALQRALQRVALSDESGEPQQQQQDIQSLHQPPHF
jgi:hypothetical protein